ncbi:glycosyltransferase involved in cell wall biosynthesis [Flavobacteriaceae bacterium MAR_2010_105]|nr:glycosyltransferase involved in cell wall biosynthesis [Flavobacteriaceae bacterium MAR_2010_105]
MMDEILPIVTIIIPVYNRAKTIGPTLESVLSQSFRNWECLVVDDGSTDDSLTIINEFTEKDKRISLVLRDRLPKGAPTCRNIGLQKAKGDFVIFLDSDDFLLPFCLEHRLAQFNIHTNHDFLVFPMGVKKNDEVVKEVIFKSDSYLIDFLSFKLAWSIMCPIWKKDFLLKLGGFTEGYPRFNDPELVIRGLLQNDVLFKVFYDLDFDSIYVPAKMDKLVYKDKVFKSLLLFIPDIVSTLKISNNLKYKKHLSNYLFLWFDSFYEPLKSSKIGESTQLLLLFSRYGIISFWKTVVLFINLLGYAFFNYFYQRFRWRLIKKSFYN